MLTRNKKLKDYGIPAEDIEKLNTILKDFPAKYGYLLSSVGNCANGEVRYEIIKNE